MQVKPAVHETLLSDLKPARQTKQHKHKHENRFSFQVFEIFQDSNLVERIALEHLTAWGKRWNFDVLDSLNF